MKLGHDKAGAKKTMRVAAVFTGMTAVFTGMTAAATGFAPAAVAKGPAQSNSTRRATATPDVVAGDWILSVLTDSATPHHVYACEYNAGRTGHSCSLLNINPGGVGVTAHSPHSNGVFLFEGHIELAWSVASAKPSFVIKGAGGLKVQQYTVTAEPGGWNQCTLPASHFTIPEPIIVEAFPGVPSCR